MNSITINEDIIFTVRSGKFLVWNLRSGEQYEIFEKRYLDRLYELTTALPLAYVSSEEDHELSEAGLLETRNEPSAPKETQWGWDDIAKIFHLGSKHNFPADLSSESESAEQGYLDFCESIANDIPCINIEKDGKIISLPSHSPSSLATPLISTLMNRKTSRHFEPAPVSLEVVANLLFTTFGKIHGDTHIRELEKRGVKSVGYRRSSPSAGCLQATEAYLIALNVNDLPMGIYHYRSHQHSLTLVNEEISDLNKTLCHQSFASDAAFLIVMTSRFDKLWWKYPHSRAYRSALLDVGHLSQTFNLAATALGMNTWITGYFIDDLLNEIVGADGIKEHSIFVAAAGPGHSDPLSPEMQKLI